MRAPTHIKKLRFLIVEDHAFQLTGIEIQLNQIGHYHLTPAADYAEALSIAESSRTFDVLICDQHLPDGLGINLIEHIFNLGKIHHAILFSGIDDENQIKETLSLGRSKNLPLLAYLRKPLLSQNLLNALKPIYNESGYNFSPQEDNIA